MSIILALRIQRQDDQFKVILSDTANSNSACGIIDTVSKNQINKKHFRRKEQTFSLCFFLKVNKSKYNAHV